MLPTNPSTSRDSMYAESPKQIRSEHMQTLVITNKFVSFHSIWWRGMKMAYKSLSEKSQQTIILFFFSFPIPISTFEIILPLGFHRC